MKLLRTLVAIAALVWGMAAPSPADTGQPQPCDPVKSNCSPVLQPNSEPICYMPADRCPVTFENLTGPVQQPVEVHFKAVPVGQVAFDFVPELDGLAVIQPGKTTGESTVWLVANPPLPKEEFTLEITAVSAGKIAVPWVRKLITLRG
jgi:hypothetical protein